MKNIIKSFAAIVALFAISTDANAQGGVSASSTMSATIVAPITISNTAGLSFGNIAVNATPGAVALNAATGVRGTPTGGVTLPATAGTVSAASFTVGGAPNYTYSIVVPSAPITINDGASNTMTVSDFTCDLGATGTIGVGGTQVLKVGATLNVGASQVAGTYGSGTTFNVDVNYN